METLCKPHARRQDVCNDTHTHIAHETEIFHNPQIKALQETEKFDRFLIGQHLSRAGLY